MINLNFILRLILIMSCLFLDITTFADEWAKVLTTKCIPELNYFRIDNGRLEGSVTENELVKNNFLNVFSKNDTFECKLPANTIELNHKYMDRPGACSYNRGTEITIVKKGLTLVENTSMHDCFGITITSIQIYNNNMEICFGEPKGPIYCNFLWGDERHSIVTNKLINEWWKEKNNY